MKIILEDRFEASLNKVFYFHLFGKESVIFSDGDNNVKVKIQECLETSENFIVAYMDVVPDNLATIKVYFDTVIQFLDYEVVYVLPVFCSEYLNLLLLSDLDLISDEYKSILTMGIFYRDINLCKRSKTFEKACKAIMSKFNSDFNNLILDKNSIESYSCRFLYNHKNFPYLDIMQKYYRNLIESSYSSALTDFLEEYKNMLRTFKNRDNKDKERIFRAYKLFVQ